MKYIIQDDLNKNFNPTLDYKGIRKRIMIIISKLHKLSNDRDEYKDNINLLESIEDRSIEDSNILKQYEKKLANCNYKINMLNDELITLQLKIK